MCWLTWGLLTFATSPLAVALGQTELATFTADISPPLRQRVCVGFIPEFTEIEHPLLAKGVVLRDAGGVYVLCALDYEGLCNESYDAFRDSIARAAGTTADRVAVQSLHQHTAPVLDRGADRLLYANDPVALHSGLKAEEDAIAAIVAAIERAATSFRRVTHVGTPSCRAPNG